MASAFLCATTAAAQEPADPGPAAIPPALDFAPGPEYADAARMFQGIPGIERAPNGRLWATWYGGGVTEDKHNYILLDTSGDDGTTWKRVLIIDPDRDGPVRAFDPCLWHDPDGRLWLFWAQRASAHAAHLFEIHTGDAGGGTPKWSEPRRVCDGIMMNKPTVLADGRWLLPVATWKRDGSARVVESGDRGASWREIGAANVPQPGDRNCDEHMIVQRRDGGLWMLVRTRYGIGESVSTDGGKSWSDVAKSDIPHPVSRFFIRRLVSGRLLLVRHDPPDNAKVRSHLKAFVSDDDGKTWKGGLLLDERSGVSYPDGVQAPDGSICVIYDWERQRDKEILMACFTEEDAARGRPASPKARLRIRVNQATGANSALHAKAILSPNADGAPLLEPASTEIDAAGGEIDTLAVGARLFLDRRYAALEVPPGLRGRKFVRSSIAAVKAVCRQPGPIYVLTPSVGRNDDSLAADLKALGFQKAKLPEFMLFPGDGNICSIFQKRAGKDEPIALGKWGVLVY